eukprot:NODE_459_length_7203_cov_0.898226.p3 type:complete len:315 gc:universal NODE_459_length_7203_cov_0.898226:577-1521(+)
MSLNIKLNQPVINPGDTIKGVCIINLNEKCKDILIEFEGREKTRWKTGGGKNTQIHQQAIQLVNESVSILDESLKNQKITHHEIPFEISTGDLLGSFHSNVGQITYTITLKAIKTLINKDFTCPIQINHQLPIFNPQIIATNFQKKVFNWFKPKQIIDFTVEIPNMMLPGQSIPVKLNISNQSKKSIRKMKINLVNHLHFKAHRRTRNKVHVISSIDPQINLAPFTSDVISTKIDIPTNLQPTLMGQIIQSTYGIQIITHYPGMTSQSSHIAFFTLGSEISEKPKLPNSCKITPLKFIQSLENNNIVNDIAQRL